MAYHLERISTLVKKIAQDRGVRVIFRGLDGQYSFKIGPASPYLNIGNDEKRVEIKEIRAHREIATPDFKT